MDAVAVVSAVSNVILVVITGVYVRLTHRISEASRQVADLTKQQVISSQRPYVTISVISEARTSMFYLRIANLGRSEARNLRLEMDPPFFKLGNGSADSDISKYNAFTDSIASFGPDAELLFYLAQAFVVFAPDADPKLTPQVFNVRAKYEYVGGEANEVSTVDLRPYLGSTVEYDREERRWKDMTTTLDKIAGAVADLKADG